MSFYGEGMLKMRGLLRRLLPQKIKFRLFFGFVLVILIPLFILQLYYYRQTEDLIVNKISEQFGAQLNIMKTDYNDTVKAMFLHLVQLEKEPAVMEALQAGDNNSPSDNARQIREVLEKMRNRNLSQSRFLYVSVADVTGSQYDSFDVPQGERLPDWNAKAIRELENSKESYRWLSADRNDLPVGLSESAHMLTLTGSLKEQGKLVGVVRIRFDYEAWMKGIAKDFPVQQNYYLADEAGNLLAQTEKMSGMSSEVGRKLLQSPDQQLLSYIDERYSMLYNSITLTPQKWQIIGEFPLRFYFGDLKLLERRMVITFLLLTVAFIGLTLFVSSTITRPLHQLKKKMENMVKMRLKTFLPETNYRGEILALAQSFNQMVTDTNLLVHQLKQEERQKEAVRFQMLLAQMKPHFLLNTLNTLKWHAIDREDKVTSEICIQLGKLLETSLNAEVELIHLKEEIELINAYLYIQNVRFDHLFDFRYEYEEKLQYVLVPKLSLQPLVENAIVHGFARMSRGGLIVVRIYEQHDSVVVEVQDNGQGLQEAERVRQKRVRKGIGLTNVKERLELLFKKNAELQLMELEEGALVRLRFPMLMSVPYSKGGDHHVETDHR
ncbi:histidine kinase [Paenibacillus qinlingensis]|nr:histidine kinase [Paenibacillus qinlingensis]